MPEGDTIHRAARRLDAALRGKEMRRFAAPRLRGRRPQPGTTITAVEARGKHLIVHFDRGPALHSHMGMTGSWHVYRAGEPWRRPARLAHCEIETADGTVAVCFTPARLDVIDPLGQGRPQRVLSALGPDLCRAGADLALARARFDALPPDTELGVALLDQRVACGVGNVYKSEICFACRIDPFTPVAAIDAATRDDLLTTAARLLQANLGSTRRATVPGGLAVYNRSGRPCRRCGRPVRRRRQGEQARTTFWCPSCQPGRDLPSLERDAQNHSGSVTTTGRTN